MLLELLNFVVDAIFPITNDMGKRKTSARQRNAQLAKNKNTRLRERIENDRKLRINKALTKPNLEIKTNTTQKEVVKEVKKKVDIPILRSKNKYILKPTPIKNIKIGDIVFVKVKGIYLQFKVKLKDKKKGVQIIDEYGIINGWTRNINHKYLNTK